MKFDDDKIKAIIESDHHVTVQEIEEMIKIPKSTIELLQFTYCITDILRKSHFVMSQEKLKNLPALRSVLFGSWASHLVLYCSHTYKFISCNLILKLKSILLIL